MGETPHIAEQEASFTPDFLIIPARIAFDKELQPLDSKVYAVIYWFEKLKDGRCWASNKTIAKIIGANSTSVSHSISRLFDKHYIILTLDENNHRKSIICTQAFHAYYKPSSNEQGGVAQMSNIDSNTKKRELSSETQKDIELIYKVWLIYMVVDPDIRVGGSTDDKHSALLAAKKHTRLTDKRKAKIAGRLKDVGADRLKRAIINLSKSDFHRNGSEDSNWRATIEWLCGSYEKTEEWANK